MRKTHHIAVALLVASLFLPATSAHVTLYEHTAGDSNISGLYESFENVPDDNTDEIIVDAGDAKLTNHWEHVDGTSYSDRFFREGCADTRWRNHPAFYLYSGGETSKEPDSWDPAYNWYVDCSDAWAVQRSTSTGNEPNEVYIGLGFHTVTLSIQGYTQKQVWTGSSWQDANVWYNYDGDAYGEITVISAS